MNLQDLDDKAGAEALITAFRDAGIGWIDPGYDPEEPNLVMLDGEVSFVQVVQHFKRILLTTPPPAEPEAG